ncbi:MAG: hypothetical protein HY885_09400 [Deltaproteobacteria bacterium]|nr:hypothetical protein [Deltaproteobacteria bacterium]
MSVSNSHLAEEYDEIKNRFSASPYIRILATTGTPPESYEIEYRVKGLSKVAEGRAVTVDTHRVQIVLPFGYPHFPPNCKPLTAIFHPDFDPDAICIGDFWNSSPSLADLIVHIGKLISYQAWSMEDVFNLEALNWAKANTELLPLDRADFTARVEQRDEEPALSAGDVNESKGSSPVQPGEAEIASPAAAIAPTPPVHRDRGPGKARTLMKCAGAVLLFACAFGALVMFDFYHYDRAKRTWSEVASLVGQNNYVEADTRLKSAQALLDKVLLVKKSERLALRQEISKLRDSQPFKEGVSGRSLVDGRYVTAKEQQEIKEVSELLAEGETLAAAERWAEAVEVYGKAAARSATLGPLAPMPAERVDGLLKESRVHEQISTGNAYRSEKKWDKALNHFEEALALLDGMQGEQWLTTRSEVEVLIGESGFLTHVEQGNGFFSGKQWSQAATSYDKALKMIKLKREEGDFDVKKVAGQRDLARFNAFYETGLADFTGGRWDGAIANLEKSEALLATASAAGTLRDITASSIKRKILKAQVNRGEEAVAAYLEEEKYGQASAALKSLVGLIDKSPFASEKEFAQVRNSAADRMIKNRFLDEIQQKITYLHGRYEAVFKEFFPSVARSKLSDPQITFVKQEGNLLVFKMQCQEEVRSQNFTLEMIYQYDTKSGEWSARPQAEGNTDDR